MISATHLHAMAIHFPIALLLIGFLSELASVILKNKFFAQAAFYLLLIGVTGAIISYFSGYSAGEGMEDGAFAKAMEWHEQAATVALLLSLVTAALYIFSNWKKVHTGWMKSICILMFTSSIVAISITGYLGGQLVYKHGAGVEISLPDFSKPE
jgi:uncharacterized membrane protein